MKFSAIFILCLTLSGLSAAQTVPEPKWTMISSAQGDFSVSYPPEVITSGSTGHAMISSSNSETSFVISLFETEGAKAWAKADRTINVYTDLKISRFVSGDFIVEMSTIDKTPFYISIELTSSKGIYTVTIASKTAKDAVLTRMLNSIRLNGKPLIKHTDPDVTFDENKISAKSVTTSKVISDALVREQKTKIDVNYGKGTRQLSDLNTIYSRPFLVLKKDRPSYTDAARQGQVQGTIWLMVEFKGNGDIGMISIAKGLPQGLNNEAVEAAKKIKFLPAEIDGKPADVTRIVTYSFAFY